MMPLPVSKQQKLSRSGLIAEFNFARQRKSGSAQALFNLAGRSSVTATRGTDGTAEGEDCSWASDNLAFSFGPKSFRLSYVQNTSFAFGTTTDGTALQAYVYDAWKTASSAIDLTVLSQLGCVATKDGLAYYHNGKVLNTVTGIDSAVSPLSVFVVAKSTASAYTDRRRICDRTDSSYITFGQSNAVSGTEPKQWVGNMYHVVLYNRHVHAAEAYRIYQYQRDQLAVYGIYI